jgi:rubrerythrin
MLLNRDSRAVARSFLVAAVAMGVALAAWGATPTGVAGKSPGPAAPPPEAAAPAVGNTRANLQVAFDSEINAKERYLAFAKKADAEGYAYVAHLFRACSRAEEVHAAQHVHAIAWTGGEAKAMLQRLSLGTTPENVQMSINLETYEAEKMYPAMLERAKAERQAEAVRSITFALAAEREHARLLTAALQSIDQRPAKGTFFVCPTCGRTTAALSFTKCPTCFTSARKFIRVT